MSESAKLPAMILGAWCVVGPVTAHATETGPVRFRPLDVFIDTGDIPLAAYQVELVAVVGDSQIVGVEGGAHAAFKDPPYYDAKALMGGRIILAAFNIGDDLPTGRHRVCTLHVREAGPVPPDYGLELIVAADPTGRPVRAKVAIEPRKVR